MKVVQKFGNISKTCKSNKSESKSIINSFSTRRFKFEQESEESFSKLRDNSEFKFIVGDSKIMDDKNEITNILIVDDKSSRISNKHFKTCRGLFDTKNRSFYPDSESDKNISLR